MYYTSEYLNGKITEEKLDNIKSLLLDERLHNFERVLSLRTRRLTLCLEDMFHPHNASATLRTAEAFGIQEINVVETLCKFSPAHDIVRGTDRWLNIEHWSSTEELVRSLRMRGYKIVVTSPHPGSHTIEEYRIGADSIALFMGTEETGISPKNSGP